MPDLVLLRREARDVARSLYRLDWIPGRSKYGLLFFLQPDDPVLRPLPGWRELTDYQLCYWHALETEARQAAYGAAVRGWGGRAVDVETGRLAEPGYFEAIAEDFGIPLSSADRERLTAIRGRRFNTKAEDTPAQPRRDRPRRRRGRRPPKAGEPATSSVPYGLGPYRVRPLSGAGFVGGGGAVTRLAPTQ